MSLRDRVVEAAVTSARPADRDLLASELNRRLDNGGLALLLDSLDETYERHGSVVSDIETMLEEISPDTDVVLATRDTGYAQAATLGWPTLRQGEPEELSSLIDSVVAAVRAHQTTSAGAGADADAAMTVEQRDPAAWVKSEVNRHSVLLQTPLMPVLLALLAGERDQTALPISSAGTLREVIRNVIGKYELMRRPDTPLGNLTGTRLHEALMQCFAIEGAMIMDRNGRCPEETAMQAIADGLQTDWGMRPAEANAAAREAIRFFDESGVFIAAGASRDIAPRIALFAEMGAALHATQKRDVELSTWAARCIEGNQYEPLVLASMLSRHAAVAFGDQIHPASDRALVQAAVRAHAEGAQFAAAHLSAIFDHVVSAFAQGGEDGWEQLSTLLRLPLYEEDRIPIEHAAATYDPDRRTLVSALLDLALRDNTANIAEPNHLVEVLTITALTNVANEESERATTKTYSLRGLRSDQVLRQAQIRAAQVLVGHNREAEDVVKQLAEVDASGYRPFRELHASIARHNCLNANSRKNRREGADRRQRRRLPRELRATHQVGA